MIYLGLDDTDTLDTPGTNQLARHLVGVLAGTFTVRQIVRHQLLEDPRVPCTKRNGCASLLIDAVGDHTSAELISLVRPVIHGWCLPGSDPGFCVTQTVPAAVVEWGLRCQRELVSQAEARQLAAEHEIHLEGLGGTNDGVIGALAAVGLITSGNDGRIIYWATSSEDLYHVTGPQTIAEIRARGIDEILHLETLTPITDGVINVGKRLRPNYRQGKAVLYVTEENGSLIAARIK